MSIWNSFEPSACYPDKCQCEFARDELIRQPSSFWSSLAYLLAALFIYKNVANKTRELKLWTAACVLMGLSSLFGHGSFIKLSLAMDFASIILILSFFALLKYVKKFQVSKILTMVVIYYIAVFFAMYAMDKWQKIGVSLFIFALSLREIGWQIKTEKTLQLSIFILVLSFGLFLIDEFHIGCNPYGAFQWHSVWHIGSAIAMYYYGKWRFRPMPSI